MKIKALKRFRANWLRTSQFTDSGLESASITDMAVFLGLDKVNLAPPSITWTHELFRDISHMVCSNILDLAHGKRPGFAVIRKFLIVPRFRKRGSVLS